jgi:hypothetical protein
MECRVCGIALRPADDVIVADGHGIHAACAEAPVGPKRRRLGVWASFGARGQMAMGDPQLDTAALDND